MKPIRLLIAVLPLAFMLAVDGMSSSALAQRGSRDRGGSQDESSDAKAAPAADAKDADPKDAKDTDAKDPKDADAKDPKDAKDTDAKDPKDAKDTDPKDAKDAKDTDPKDAKDTDAKDAKDADAAKPTTPTPGSKVTTPDGQPVAIPVVATFGGASTATGPADKLKFTFVQAPWADVITLFADSAGLTWDREVTPPGTFTYSDPKEYTATEALNVLNGALLQKGFLLVRRDRFAVILNLDNPIPSNVVETVPISALSKRAANELVRVVMTLEGKDSDKAAEEVEPLLGPQGKVSSLSVANSIVVVGPLTSPSR